MADQIKRVLLIDVTSDEDINTAALELTAKISNGQINIVNDTEVEREDGKNKAEKFANVAGTCVSFLLVCSEALTNVIDKQDYSSCNSFFKSEGIDEVIQKFSTDEQLKSRAIMVLLENHPHANPSKFEGKEQFSDKSTEDDINKLRSKIMNAGKPIPIKIEKIKEKRNGCKTQ